MTGRDRLPAAPSASRIEELMNRAQAAARLSPNRVRQVGATLAAVQGASVIARCNSFPKGVRDLPERHEGDGRFVWMEHAERNAILEAARQGIATEAGTLATTFFPCIDCARAIVQSGIAHLCTPAPDYEDAAWGDAFHRSRVILEEGGVAIHVVEGGKAVDTPA
ncbi:dCMP deaminase [Rhizobiales bacterium GAS188]|nr:dCMP deaminase [Rhizobiales bacterium GAS188]